MDGNWMVNKSIYLEEMDGLSGWSSLLHRPCGCSRKTYEHVSTVQSTRSAYLNQFWPYRLSCFPWLSSIWSNFSRFPTILNQFPTILNHFQPTSSAMFQRISPSGFRAHREPRDLGASPGGVVEALVTQEFRFGSGDFTWFNLLHGDYKILIDIIS